MATNCYEAENHNHEFQIHISDFEQLTS